MTYLWIVIVLLAIAVEAATADLVAIWFMPAALVSMVLSLLDVSIGIQVAVFFVLVVVFMLLSKLFLRRYLKRRPNEKTNADSLLGKTAIVTERIENEAQSGAVRVGGLEWSARAVSDTMVIEKDTLVVIREIAGVKLICEPK
ncbi:MAG: NfeD family protein [Clostridia bacterium]|nr:NfeD family protein [Clostridia bacterium]